MTEGIRCRQLRERDYFDADYDLKYDEREQHWCLYFTRRVIPHDECGLTCPGYTAWTAAPDALARDSSSTTARARQKTAKVSRETLLREIDQVIKQVARS